MGNKKIEFPTSPQPLIVEEITHYTHPKHPLTKVNLSELFTCNGCKEYGYGNRFACQECDFQLHESCASSPPLLKNHPLHGQHQLVFHAKQAKAGISWPKCDVCNKSTKGFAFRCKACGFQMHPCCAMLSTERNFPVHPHTLKLLPSSSDTAGIKCGECDKKRSGRVYHCTVCTVSDYHLHAVCAKNLINGLRGVTLPKKPNSFGTAAGLATKVAIEFVGGLFEGFGETIGQYLLQNIVRGKSGRRSRTVNI